MRIIGASGSVAVVKYTVFSLMFLLSCIGIIVYGGRGDEIVPVYNTAETVPKEEALVETPKKETEEIKEERPMEDVPEKLLMIDAGHGGEDGGAISESGVYEKDLNLLVADTTAHYCLMFGVPYKMTREDDRMLYDKYEDLSDYTGKKKALDLKNRLKYAKESGASLLLSVHMNKFTSENVTGLQVYYSPSASDGESLASSIHSYVAAHIQPDNDRAAKRADSSIYLLNRAEMPALLVEYGFLSNPMECRMLCDTSYRASLSASVFIPVLEYFIRT